MSGSVIVQLITALTAPWLATRLLDYSVLVPRAVPGLLAGLSFLWVFLFVPSWLDGFLKMSDSGITTWLSEHLIPALREVRSTIFALWLAYSVVWLAYGMPPSNLS